MMPPRNPKASGQDLLDARAMWAAIVGPQRLAMAQKKSVVLNRTRGVLLAENIAAADGYAFVGVALPPGTTPGLDFPLGFLFSKDDTLGLNSSFPMGLAPAGGIFGANGGFGLQNMFMQLLLPGEQLFGQLANGGIFEITEQRVIVAQVMF